MERQLLNVSPKARLLSVDYGSNPKDYQKAPIRITFRYEIPGYATRYPTMPWQATAARWSSSLSC